MTAVKYSITSTDNTLKLNNIVFGINNVDYGPTSSTGFWSSITPPVNGYTIYTVSAERPEPSIVCARNDSEVIFFAKSFGGTNINTIADALSYIISLTGTTIVNMDYPNIITSGLTLNLDAGFIPSYPRTGTTVYDLCGYTSGATSNICTFSAIGTTFDITANNSFIFDGSNGTIITTLDFSSEIRDNFSFGAWAMPDSDSTITLKAESTSVVAGTTGQRYLFYPYNSNQGDRSGAGISVATNGIQVFEHSAGYMPCLLSYSSTTSSYQFTHIMVVYRSKQPSLYINGSLVKTGLTSPRTFVSPMIIYPGGGYLPYGTFKGKISTVMLYNRALSDTEILQNYDATKSRFIDADLEAFLTATNITDYTIKYALYGLVTDLKSYNLWNKMTIIYPFVGGTETTHKYNLKDPRDSDNAYRIGWSGGVIHSVSGITGNGSNSQGITYLTDNLLDINNKHACIYPRVMVYGSGDPFGATQSVARFQFWNPTANYSTLNLGQTAHGPDIQAGFHLMNKTAADTFKYYENSKSPVTKNGTNTASSDVWRLLSSGDGYYSSINLAFASLGESLTETEISNYKTTIQTFQTALGRQV